MGRTDGDEDFKRSRAKKKSAFGGKFTQHDPGDPCARAFLTSFTHPFRPFAFSPDFASFASLFLSSPLPRPDSPKLADHAASFIKPAQISILLVPVHPIKRHKFERYADLIRRFSKIPLSDVPSDPRGERGKCWSDTLPLPRRGRARQRA